MVFPCPEAGVRCDYSIRDTYINKLPPVVFQKDWIYLKPLGDDEVSKSSKSCYAVQPCDKNKRAGMVKSMFAMIGVSGKTNHSLRATDASATFQAAVPEKIVQERTGHCSVQVLRMYERTTTTQHMAVLRILPAQNDEKTTFNSVLSRVHTWWCVLPQLCHSCQCGWTTPPPPLNWTLLLCTAVWHLYLPYASIVIFLLFSNLCRHTVWLR